MKRLIPVLLLALSLNSCGGGSSGGGPTVPPPPPPPPPPTAAEELADDLQGLTLDDYYETSYKALITRSPENVLWQAVGAVYPVNGVLLDDLSDGYQRDTFAMHQVALDALRTYDRSTLTPEEQVDYDVYEWFLQDVADQAQWIYYDFKATYFITATPRRLERLFTDIHPMATRQDAEDYITRLRLVRPKFTQLSNHLLNARDAGVVEPLITLQVAMNQVGNIGFNTPVDQNPYFGTFVAKLSSIPGLTDADRDTLRGQARSAVNNQVIPAYQNLWNTLSGLQSSAPSSIGVGQYPRGAEYYAYALRHHTTSDLTPAEIHQLGLDELQRIHSEMRLIFDQLGYPQNETFEQLFARVATDGGIIPAADVRSTYEAIIAAAELRLPDAFDIFPQADVVVADDDFGGFYIGPSFDGTRPGSFFAGTMNDQAYYQMPSLTYHESVPGHHTQIALAMESDARPFRKLVRSTGFVEGWALYAERLAWEQGWYDTDVYGDLGRLYFEALRAARLVVDTGIHSLGWSFAQAAQFNQDNVGMSLGSAQGAAGRYSVWPGQAAAYMVGMLEILDARQRAMDALGAQFDLREFHRVLLTNGSMPLPVMHDVVDRYIADTLAGQ